MSLGGIGNLDYTVLLCTKMDETRAFYRDVMKFPIETDQAALKAALAGCPSAK